MNKLQSILLKNPIRNGNTVVQILIMYNPEPIRLISTSAPASNTPNIQPLEKNKTPNSGEIIVVKSEDDWEKVILTQTASEVEGLIKKGELKESTVNLGVMMTPIKKTEDKLRMKIQKDAAKIGAHIVLITPMVEGSSFSLSGISYGYK